MNKKYIVRLSDEERQQLIDLTTTGKAVAYKITDS
jgi:predicted DNA-binding protein